MFLLWSMKLCIQTLTTSWCLHSRGTQNLVKRLMMDNLQCDHSDGPQLWTNGVIIYIYIYIMPSVRHQFTQEVPFLISKLSHSLLTSCKAWECVICCSNLCTPLVIHDLTFISNNVLTYCEWDCHTRNWQGLARVSRTNIIITISFSKYPKRDACLKEIRLHTQNLLTIPGFEMSMIGRGVLHDQWIRENKDYDNEQDIQMSFDSQEENIYGSDSNLLIIFH